MSDKRCAWVEGEREDPRRYFLPRCYGGASEGPEGCYCDDHLVPEVAIRIDNLELDLDDARNALEVQRELTSQAHHRIQRSARKWRDVIRLEQRIYAANEHDYRVLTGIIERIEDEKECSAALRLLHRLKNWRDHLG